MQTNAPESSPLLNRREAASYLKISLRTLDNYIGRHRIPRIKFGDTKSAIVRFRRTDLDQFLSNLVA